MNNRELKTIIKLFEASELSQLKLEKENVKIELHKAQKEISREVVEVDSSKPSTPPKPTQKEAEPSNRLPIKAPLVGTFYEAPSPDQPPFVKLGQSVKKGDTLFIIEAMKVMNEITAPQDGVIESIHIENGDMVMYDQTVMEIT